ncbi:MAG: TIGR04086 family membrane protein [Clostridia bacterium]|nr:TIGR04086 family membrane protein [Clostridia bacterium]
MNKTKPVKRKTAARATVAEEDSPALWVKHLGKSLLFTVLSGFGILLILSLIAYFYKDPNALILPLALAGAALTAFLGGIWAVRIHGHSALICGLLNGCLLMGLMMLLSLFFTDRGAGYSTGIACLLHAGVPFLSVLGAYSGLRRSPKKKNRNHSKTA